MSKQEAERLADVLADQLEDANCVALETATLLRQWPDVCASLSWDGFMIYGSIKSVEQVKQMQHGAGTVPELKQRINSDAARIAELERAIDDALVSAHIGTLESFPNPRAAIHALEAWNATVALDPAVSEEAAKLHERIAELEAGLRFYAAGDHFNRSDDAWDTVSGEPQNFWCDEAGTATVEDGTVAREALVGVPLEDERIAEMRLELDALRTENATLRATLKQAREALDSIKRDHWAHWPMKDVHLANAAIQAIDKTGA